MHKSYDVLLLFYKKNKDHQEVLFMENNTFRVVTVPPNPNGFIPNLIQPPVLLVQFFFGQILHVTLQTWIFDPLHTSKMTRYIILN